MPVVAGGLIRVALPVVAGGVALPVVAGGAFVLAVLGLLFQPAIRMIAISTSTATPATQPHILLLLADGRLVGVLYGSLMATLLGFGLCLSH